TIFAASDDPGVSVLRAVLEAGASDVLSLPLGRQELHKALIRFSQLRTKTGPAQAAGSVLTVYGVRGGLGATTLAVNLAARLHTALGAETALVDLDLQRGDVAAFLNLTPVNSLAALASAAGAVDEIFLAGTLEHPARTRGPGRDAGHPRPRLAPGRGARDRQGGLPRPPPRRPGGRRRHERGHAAPRRPRGRARDGHRRAGRQAGGARRAGEGQAGSLAATHLHEGDAGVKLKDRIGLNQKPAAP